MMKSIRDHAQGILAKLLLILLVLSFGVWGIGDIFRQGGEAVSVARAGNLSISMHEYQRALRIRTEQLRQVMGNAYNPDTLKKMGLEIHVLFGLVNNALIAQEAQSLGIRVSDDEVRSAIAGKTEFASKTGHFDKAVYLEALRTNGMSEAGFVEDVRKDIAAKLLTDTITSNAVVGESMVLQLYKARQEQRSAEIMVMPANAVSHVPEPTDKDIASYYAEHKKEFVAPEYRTFSVIAIPLKDVAAKITVPPDDIRRAYEEHKADFHHLERRVTEQLVFERQAEAQAASARLQKGETFAEVAASPSVTNKGRTAMGEITREGAPTDGDAIFALKEGASTSPIQSAFGWHIFHVSRIEPEGTETLEQASPMIARDLAEKQAQDAIGKQVTDLEDTLAGGATLDKAAAQAGEKVQTFGPVAQDGTSPEGKPVALPAYDNLLKIAFQTGEKENSQMAQSNDGSYFLVHIDGVTESHIKPLAEVKPQVIAAWKEQKSHTLLRDAVEAADKDVHAGKPPVAALAAHGIASVAPVTVAALRRGSEQVSTGALAGKPIPHALLSELFTLAPHRTTAAAMLPDGSYMMATLVQVTPASQPADAKALQALREELKTTVSDEMLHDYLGYLRLKYKVSVNEAVFAAKDDGGADNAGE